MKISFFCRLALILIFVISAMLQACTFAALLSNIVITYTLCYSLYYHLIFT